jgi:hypothetical protein
MPGIWPKVFFEKSFKEGTDWSQSAGEGACALFYWEINCSTSATSLFRGCVKDSLASQLKKDKGIAPPDLIEEIE